MKKFISLLVVAALLIGCMATTAFADETETVHVTVSDATAKQGDTVTLSVSVSEATYATWLMTVTYDAEALELVSFNTDNAMIFSNTDTGKISELGWVDTVRSGDLFTMTFQVLADHGDHTVGIEVGNFTMADMTKLPSTVTAGTVSVTHDHAWNDGEVTTAPGCETEGVKTYTCTICGEIKTEAVDALGHSFGEWIETTAPTCTEAGVETRTCASCGETETREVAALGHSYGDWTITTVPTCTEAGVEIRTCAICDETETREVAALGHSFGEWTVTTAPSCTEKGVETRTCTVCGETETREVAALGHDCDNWTVTKEPTCTEEGLKTGTCSVCGENQATEVIPALGHTVGEWVSDAENHWYVCAVCEEKVDAAAHTFDWIVDKKATAKEDGLKHEECSVCGYAKEGVKIPATGEELDDVPQTGDLNADPAMFILVMFGAAAATGVMIFKRKVIK